MPVDLPRLDPALLLEPDDLDLAVEAHIARVPAPTAGEFPALTETLFEVLGPEHGEQLRHLLDLVANRHVEVTASLVRTAITDTSAFLDATVPVTPEPGEEPRLDETMFGHEVLLGWAVDQLLRHDPRHRRQGAQIRRRQQELRRIVSRAAWQVYLRVEAIVNARMADDEVIVVAWAYRQGTRRRG